MQIPDSLKKAGKFLLDLVELYVPMAAFSIMFILFLLGVFYRYFLNNPLTWPYEASILGFIWTAVLGAAYTRRTRSHVAFTLIYDYLAPRRQVVWRIIGNGMIALVFLISLYPSWDYVQFMAFQKTTVLRIPFNIAYFPYVVFLILVIGHSVYDMVLDIRNLQKGEGIR